MNMRKSGWLIAGVVVLYLVASNLEYNSLNVKREAFDNCLSSMGATTDAEASRVTDICARRFGITPTDEDYP